MGIDINLFTKTLKILGKWEIDLTSLKSYVVFTCSPVKQFADKHFFHGSFLPGPSTCFRKIETRTENYPGNTYLKSNKTQVLIIVLQALSGSVHKAKVQDWNTASNLPFTLLPPHRDQDKEPTPTVSTQMGLHGHNLADEQSYR